MSARGRTMGGRRRPKQAIDSMSKNARAKAQAWYDHKSALMEKTLGAEHDAVMHALIPYEAGGPLDLHYYPHGITGTAIATKELASRPNAGPKNARYLSYELVMFTKYQLDLDATNDLSTPFGRAHASISAILNRTARFSEQATLNPRETCEFAEDMKGVGGKCLVFDGYAIHTDRVAKKFGLLLIVEVFRSEMNLAMEHGAAQLFARLRKHGHYPYSDLDRRPVA